MTRTAYIAIGGNLIPDGYETLEAVMAEAVQSLREEALVITKISQWFETAPVPVSDQPWFLNAVLFVETSLEAHDLLERLHHIEAEFGRTRTVRNEARILDLDLIDYREDGTSLIRDDEVMILPHPRMHLRAFVLLPIADLTADWRHPILNKSVSDLIKEMPEGQDIRQKRLKTRSVKKLANLDKNLYRNP